MFGKSNDQYGGFDAGYEYAEPAEIPNPPDNQRPRGRSHIGDVYQEYKTPTGTTVPTWEYARCYLNNVVGLDDEMALLEANGKLGWQLCAALPEPEGRTLYFKRHKGTVTGGGTVTIVGGV